MKKKQKPFSLGKDVERALAEIVSINDYLPEEYRRKIEEGRKISNEERI